MPVSEPLNARPIGLRTASTMTASGMREVSLWSGGGGILRNQHQFPVWRGLLALPGLAYPVERECLAVDRELARGGQLDQPPVGGLGLVPRHVADGESDDGKRLRPDVERAQRRLRPGRLAELHVA